MRELISGFILHKQKYRESSLLVTLLTKEHGKIKGVIKGVYGKTAKKKITNLEPFIEFEFDLKKPKQIDGIYTIYNNEIKALRLNINHDYLVQISLFYINELTNYLYPYGIFDELFYESYRKIIFNLDKNKLLLNLRMFENKLLLSLGYELAYDYDDSGKLINKEAFYLIKPMSLPILVDPSYFKKIGVISGKVLIKLSNSEAISNDAEVLNALKQIYRLYINHLLHGRELKSQSLLKSYLSNNK